MEQRIRHFSRKLGRIPAAWWVVILTLPALAPLMRPGFFESHDGVFHVYRLAALDRAVRAGVLYPRWFPEFAFGYGQPVLNFYGPLGYYWGLPFTLLSADAILAMKLVFATGLIASALGMYLFARLHLSRTSALAAAVVYVYLPYHLVDLYVRGAVAEFLAFVWFPLALWAFQRLIAEPKQRGWTWIALAALLLAALVVTHSLSVLIFAPVLVGYVTILLVKQRDRRALVRACARLAAALALAVALSAFYWLPVLTESQYVGLGHGASPGYRDHLVSLPDLFDFSFTYPYTDEPGVTPTFPLGWLQAAILAAALLLPFRTRRGIWAALFFLAVALLSIFMLTTVSLPVWRLFERGLAFLQYPWRFQALTVLATAFLAGMIWEQVSHLTPHTSRLTSHTSRLTSHVSRLTPHISRLTPHASRFTFHVSRLTPYALLLIWSLWHLPHTPTSPDLSVEAMWQMDRDFGQVGTTWTGEYLPIWVTEQRWAISHPATKTAANNGIAPAGQIRLTGVGHTRYNLEMDAPEGASLVLHQFHYPGWRATGPVANLPYHSRPEGILGLASFLSPADGSFTARLAHTPAQLWGTLFSLITALAIGAVLVARRQFLASGRPLLLATCYLLLAAVLLAHLLLPNGSVREVTQINANLEDTVELLSFTTGETTYRPGDTVSVTLYWRSLRSLDQNHKTFVHLTDAAMTRQPAQHDGDPGGGFTPTTRWLPGEIVPDAHYLSLPKVLPPGAYRLWAGMYEQEGVRNLTVLSAEATFADDRVLLGQIEVMAP